MNSTTKTPKTRGRKQTANSIRMSRTMFTLRTVHGLQLHEIADKYNNEKRRKEIGKTLTPQAVAARIKMFRFQFPDEASSILGAVASSVETTTEQLADADLVAA